MSNKVDVEKFIKLLQKSSLNWSIQNIRVSFDNNRYVSKMRGANALLIVQGDNDIIDNISQTDVWEMNFQDVVKNVKSYMGIIQSDIEGLADIQMKDEKIIVKSGNQKIQCHFCSDNIPSIFEKDGPKDNGEEVISFDIDDEFLIAFSLVKKVSSEKIYFGVENGHLFIEAGDRTNPHSNNIKISLQESEYNDMFVAFDYKSLNNIITLINGGPLGDQYDYQFRLGYMPSRSSGLVSFKKDNDAYYLMSLRENV